MKIVPMRDLKDTTKIEKLCVEEQEPIFVTKNGYGKLVIMDIEYFNRVFGDLYIASALQEGLDAYKRGEYIDGEEVFKMLKEKYKLK